MSLVSSIYDDVPQRQRTVGDIEFEIEQLKDDLSNAETAGECEELEFKIGELFWEIEDLNNA